jgi:hypothetical protein
MRAPSPPPIDPHWWVDRIGADCTVVGNLNRIEFSDGRAARTAPDGLARWAVDSAIAAGVQPAELLGEGVVMATRAGTRIRVRLASLQEQVAHCVAVLSSGRGLQLRRASANQIVEVIQALAQRAAQPVRAERST